MSLRGGEFRKLAYEPRPLQKWVHVNLKRFNCIVAHRRKGKLLQIDTLIPTPKGFKKLGDIEDGDKVFAPDGKPCTVVMAHPITITPEAYEIAFNDGTKIKACADHQWYVEKKFSLVTQKAKDGIKGWYRSPWRCGEVFNTKHLHDTMKNDKQEWYIPLSKPVERTKKKLPIPPYFLGVWLGDGSKSEALITNPIKEIQDYILKNFSAKLRQKEGVCDVVYVREMIGKIRSLGLYKNKHIPDIYKYSSIEDRKELVRGLMDTDGGVTGGANSNCFFNNNETLIDDFKEVIQSLGVRAQKRTIHREDKKNTEHLVSFKAEFCPYKLEKNKVKKFKPGRKIRRKIVSITPCDSVPMRCLTVDSKDSLFLVGKEHLPTHNSVLAINEIIIKALQCERTNPHFAYIAPTYKQAKIIAWEYIQSFTKNIPGVKYFQQDLRLEISRPNTKDKITIFLLGSDNPDAIRGIYLDGAVIDEIADCDPRLYSTVVRPALSDRLGWVLFIGTVKGKNHFYNIYKKYTELAKTQPKSYFTAMFKASQTKIIPEEELALLKQEMSEAEYLQEMECDFHAAIQGSYFSREMQKANNEGRITRVPYDEAALVDTFWDLGVGDYTTIWFRQKVGSEWHYIDYIEANGEGMKYYIKKLHELPYVYGKHVFPHDVKQRELLSGNSRLDGIRKLGLKNIQVQARKTVEDRIEAARQRIGTSWFDKDKCAIGIEHLRSYQKRFDRKLGIFLGPLHDEASHGADAFGYSALDKRAGDYIKDLEHLPTTADSDYDDLKYMGGA